MITETSISFIVLVLVAYLIGSVSSAVLVCRRIGAPDPRRVGSGNPGASNVWRIAGKRAALWVLLADAGKGLIAMSLAQSAGLSPIEQALVALAAISGHLYPLYFQFKGGKGVATAFGASLLLSWPTTLVLLILWLTLVAASGRASVGSITAALIAPFCALYFHPEHAWGYALLAALILLRHRRNMVNLWHANELRLQPFADAEASEGSVSKSQRG